MAAITVEPSQDETRAAVLRGLTAHNQSRIGPRNARPLAISLRDDSGTIVGYLYDKPTRAVRWTPVGSSYVAAILSDIGSGGAAFAIASDGTVAGSVNRSRLGNPRPAFWSPQSATPSLLQIPNGSYGEAEDIVIAPNGMIVAGYQSPSGPKQATRWRAAQ